MNRRRQACDAGHSQADQIPEARSRGDDHDRENHHHDQRRPEVWLLVHEQDGHPGQDQNGDEVPREHGVLAAAVNGDHDDEGEGGELGGLHLERPQCEPALRTERDVPEMGQHRQQRQHDEAVEHVGPLLEPVVVDQVPPRP